jgi:hypothetical protein
LSRTRNDRPHRQEQQGKLDPFHLHAQDLSFGVVFTLDSEHDVYVGAGGEEGSACPVVFELLPSLLIGAPSKNHSGRRCVPELAELVERGDDFRRCLNAGSRY